MKPAAHNNHSTCFSKLAIAFSPITFTQFDAKPDAAKPGFYSNVLILQKGAAKGHYAVKDGNRMVNFNASNPDHAELRKYQIVIGDETLDDVTRCGAEAENTKCKLDHGATVRDIVGNYTTFRRVGDQVRADLTLMKSTPHRGYVEELFSDFAKKVGNSIDFDYQYDIQGEHAVARCVKLNSVDIVDAPAATNSLFNENQPPPNHMPLSKEDLDAINGVVTKAVDAKFGSLQTDLNTRLGKIETSVTKLEEGDGKKEEEDDDKKKKKDEDADSAAKMSEIANKAALSAVEAAFPKLQREQFAKLSTGDTGKSKFEQLVDVQLAAGAPSRGIAIQRAARDHKTEYNAHMAAVNAGAATL